jgi:hypothetical protein
MDFRGVLESSIFLYQYKPNGYGEDVFFRYDGRPSSLEEIPAGAVSRVRGWVLPFVGMAMRRHRMIVFGDRGSIYIDTGEESFKVSDADIRVSIIQMSPLSRLRLTKGLDKVLFERWVLTPPWRYLFNDGSFPEDVEPVCAVFHMLADHVKRAELAVSLSKGIRIER